MQYKNPNYVKEAVIQAELFSVCKKAGLYCDLQYVICGGEKENQCTFDLVVVEAYDVIAIVEVKTANALISSIENSEQIKRYKKYGVPVFILYSIYDIPYLVKKLLKLKAKFLESMDSVQAKCFEADRQNEEKWNEKIGAAFNRFDEVFPDYKFIDSQSLEIFASSVKILGLPDLFKLLEESKGNVREFIFVLKRFLGYRKQEELQLLRKCYGRWGQDEVHSITDCQNRQDHIDEKLT